MGSITTLNVQTCQVMHDSKTRMPADIDDVIIRNDNVYIIYNARRIFLAVHPVSRQATWELDMDSKTGRSLQKFGDSILDIAEFDDSVYALITTLKPNTLQLNVLCVKPYSNSIYKILALDLPRQVKVVCAYSNSPHIVYHHESEVCVVDVAENRVKFREKLAMPRLTSDGAYLVGVASKRHVNLYRLSDCLLIGSFKLTTDVDCVDVSADDEYVTVVGRDRFVYAFVIGDPQQSSHTLTIRKLASRSQAPIHALDTPHEDPRFHLLKTLTSALDEDATSLSDVEAEEVKNEVVLDKPDSPLRMASVNRSMTSQGHTTPFKTFSLSYGSANLQSSTEVRLQKIKNKFIDVDFTGTPTPGPSRQPDRQRRRLLMNMMSRASSGVSVASRAHTLSSPVKSRMSVASAKTGMFGTGARGAGTTSPSKSLSSAASRPNSTMSRTCIVQ